MAVLLPLSLSLPHPTHLSPFRFRGFINIASLQGRSVHPLGILVFVFPLSFSFFFFFLKHNCIFKNITKWSTICQGIISPISARLAASDLGKPPCHWFTERAKRCVGINLPFKQAPTSPLLLSYLITGTVEMKEGHKVPPCHCRTLTAPLQTKQNRTTFDTIVVCFVE